MRARRRRFARIRKRTRVRALRAWQEEERAAEADPLRQVIRAACWQAYHSTMGKRFGAADPTYPTATEFRRVRQDPKKLLGFSLVHDFIEQR